MSVEELTEWMRNRFVAALGTGTAPAVVAEVVG
jgi:hypothetical protein